MLDVLNDDRMRDRQLAVPPFGDLVAVPERARRRHRRTIGRRLKALTGVSARVAVLAPGSLPRATHKAKRVEDRRTDLWT